jgi:hypothetical protein
VLLLLCCRSEEAALETRQAEDLAANTSARLASTKPSEARAPLARVNGQADTALGTSIVQRVWKDVVRLATATGAGGGGGVAHATPGGGAQAAADAAVMRRRALDVIEVRTGRIGEKNLCFSAACLGVAVLVRCIVVSEVTSSVRNADAGICSCV